MSQLRVNPATAEADGSVLTATVVDGLVVDDPRTTDIPTTDQSAAEGSSMVVTFAGGLPGFSHLHHFAVEPLGPELAPFCRLRSLDEGGVEFIVVPPGLLFPDYVVEIDDDATERLDLLAEDVVVLTIVTLPEAGRTPTANLLGPIVVNRRTRAAAQIIQHGSDHGVAVPLVSPGAERAQSGASS